MPRRHRETHGPPTLLALIRKLTAEAVASLCACGLYGSRGHVGIVGNARRFTKGSEMLRPSIWIVSGEEQCRNGERNRNASRSKSGFGTIAAARRKQPWVHSNRNRSYPIRLLSLVGAEDEHVQVAASLGEFLRDKKRSVTWKRGGASEASSIKIPLARA
jgi:hypothetical protein